MRSKSMPKRRIRRPVDEPHHDSMGAVLGATQLNHELSRAEYVAYNKEFAQTAESLLRNEALSVKSFVPEEMQMFLKII